MFQKEFYYLIDNPDFQESLKVRPDGQKCSRTTWYNMVVRHKTCRGSVDGVGDVCRATFYVVRPRS